MNEIDLVNEKVIHKVYGPGVIKSTNKEYLEVLFDNGKCSTFQMPSCFDKFIRFVNEEKQERILHDLDLWKKLNGVYEKEKIHQLTKATQEGIVQREKEREQRRLERAKEEAQRSRFFAGLNNPNSEEDS